MKNGIEQHCFDSLNWLEKGDTEFVSSFVPFLTVIFEESRKIEKLDIDWHFIGVENSVRFWVCSNSFSS